MAIAEFRAQLADRDRQPGPGAAARRGPAKQPGGRFDARRPPGRQAEAGLARLRPDSRSMIVIPRSSGTPPSGEST